MMKTAITVLQEMMIKSGQVPEYECVAQSGPQHQAMFEYRCKSSGVTVTARARSKKEAKQEAARRMLAELFARGVSVPPPYARPPSPRAPSPDLPQPADTKALPSTVSDNLQQSSGASLDTRSYVALLKELCEQYGLGAAEYELVGDAGPPHQRQFTERVRLGQHERSAAASTKKAAKQLAAEQLYKYLRENLARLTKDFVEEEALARAHEKAMERYVEEASQTTFRPPLGQKIADYHLGLLMHIDKEKQELGWESIEATAGTQDSISALRDLCGALGLAVRSAALGPELWLVRVEPTAPQLACAGASEPLAHAAALRYLRRALQLGRLPRLDL